MPSIQSIQYMTDLLTILQGDCVERLRELPSESVQMCVTSPPYWGLRNYQVAGQIGLESTPEEYVAKIVKVFREVNRVLRTDGTLWLNLGDSYSHEWKGTNTDNGSTTINGARAQKVFAAKVRKQAAGLKRKDLVGIPWMVAFALRADGWYLRSDIIWSKPNPMPESVTDRPTRAHEFLFLLTQSAKYFYDAESIKEPAVYFDDDRQARASEDHKCAPTDRVNGIRAVYKDARSFNGKHSDKQRGHSRRHAGFNDRWDSMTKEEQSLCARNKRDVWTVAPANFREAHFATFPPDLIKPCILAGSRPGDTVLDPFAGSGTTGQVALELGRKALLIELNPEYIKLIRQRCAITPGLPLA